MLRLLDIEPGAVSIMGLMNDRDRAVQLLIDEDVLREEYERTEPVRAAFSFLYVFRPPC